MKMWVVKSSTGRSMGNYASREEAVARKRDLESRQFGKSPKRSRKSPVSSRGYDLEFKQGPFEVRRYGKLYWIVSAEYPGHEVVLGKSTSREVAVQKAKQRAVWSAEEYRAAAHSPGWHKQPKRHAKAAKKGWRRRVSKSPEPKSMSFGVMPSYADFAARVGASYPIEAHMNSEDGRALRRARVRPSGLGDYGKNKYEISPKRLYALVSRWGKSGNEEEMSIASSIMSTLEYEWI